MRQSMLEQVPEQQAIAPKPDKLASISGQIDVILSNGNKDRVVEIYDLAIEQTQKRGSPHLPEVHSCYSELSDEASSGSDISRISTNSHISDDGRFSTPLGSAEDLTAIGSRDATPSPQPGKKIAPPSPLRNGSTNLREQPSVPPDSAPPPLLLSSSPESGDDSNKEALLRECTNRLTASNIGHPRAAKINSLTQSLDGSTAFQSPVAHRDELSAVAVDSLLVAEPSVLEPIASSAAVPSNAARNSAQPILNNLPIDIDQAPTKLSWYGITRRTIAWINYILTGFDVRDDTVENRVHHLQEKLIAHEIERILPQKETKVENKLSNIANPNNQRTYLQLKILKKENALCITKLQEQEKQLFLEETTTEKQNYDTSKTQLINELNTLYAQIQLTENPQTPQLNKVDSSSITHQQIDLFYENLLHRGKLAHSSELRNTIETAKVKYDAAKAQFIKKLNYIHDRQSQNIKKAEITSQTLNDLYERLSNPLNPVAASKYHDEIDNLLDNLDEEYDKTRKDIIHRHYIENKNADKERELIIEANKADQENRDKALKLFDEKLELNKARYNEELILLAEELERKKARYIEFLRLLEMDEKALKKNYAKQLANEEKEAVKKDIREKLGLDSLSLKEQELKLKEVLDEKNANPSFTKKNVLWGVTQATTTVIAASSGTVTAVACVGLTILFFHITLPFILLIGWAGYRVNFSVYQDSIRNTLNSFFVTGLFHDPKYPNDLTKKVGLLKKISMSLGTFFAGGAGLSIAAITYTSVLHCLVHLFAFIGLASLAAMPPVLIPIAGVVAVISLIAITALMFNTISNIIKNDNNVINRFCRKLYRKGFKKCCSDAVDDLKFFFQHLTAKDVLHGVVTALFIVAGIAIATVATITLISSWHSSLVSFLETTAGIRNIVTNAAANVIALVACYCLTPVARFPVVLEKAAITFGLFAYAICHPIETYNNCAKKLHAFKEQAKAECVDAPSTALFVGKTVLISACYIVAVTTIVGFIALNAIGNGALADEGGNILTSIFGWFAVTLPKLGQEITSFSSATAVSAAFAIVATQDTYGRPIESHDIEMKKISSNNAAVEGNGVLNMEHNNSSIVIGDRSAVASTQDALKESADPGEHEFGLQSKSQNDKEVSAPLLQNDRPETTTGLPSGSAKKLAKFSGVLTPPSGGNPNPSTSSTSRTDNTRGQYTALAPT